jgi:hypothetical protein
VVAVALGIVLVYAAFTGVTGARLLLLASRTRALPEATLGFSCIVGGMLGWAAVLVAGGIGDRAPEVARVLNAMGLFCFSAGTLSLGLFCWRVFSPENPWVAAFYFLLVATLVVDFVHSIVILGVPFPPTTSFWYWPGMLARSAIYAWRPLVALPFYFRLRRRLALGLADPVATNRVLLWGMAGAITCTSTVFVVAVTLAGLWETPARSVIAIVTVLAATADSVLGWLAFVPPRRYLAWIESRFPAPEL